MPRRSRSHELEDESIRAFEQLLPSKWVVRAKERDYGIDREVEIFDDDGRSTGLTFLVQLRGTDDVSRGSKVQLEVDELDYFHQLDLPVAVFRYSSSEQRFHWQWEEMIAARTKLKPAQKSFTYNFRQEEQWSGTSASAIRSTLEIRRALQTLPAGISIPVRLDLSALSAGERYPIERAVADMLAETGKVLVRATQTREALEIDVAVQSKRLLVRIDTVTSVSFELSEPGPEEIAASIIYGLALLLSRQRLIWHAAGLVRTIIRLQWSHRSQRLAFTLCGAVVGDLSSCVALALLNGLQRQDNEFHLAVTMLLLRSPGHAADREAAVKRFYEAVLESAEILGSEHTAATHYSIGNFYRSNHQLKLAVHHYKQSLRRRPAYASTGYFLQELAGVLYEAGRYQCAVHAYSAAIVIEPSDSLAFLHGDALFRSGRVGEAQEQYRTAFLGLEGVMREEATLKIELCNWLGEIAGTDPVPVRRSEASKRLVQGTESFETLWDVVTSVDTLHPLAHYNLGIARSQNGEIDKAIGDFLTCAFMQTNDVEAWANAALCALQLGEAEMVLAIVHVAIAHAGRPAYDRLRAQLVEKNLPEDAIASLDSVAMELLQSIDTAPNSAVIFRMLRDNSFDVIATINE